MGKQQQRKSGQAQPAQPSPPAPPKSDPTLLEVQKALGTYYAGIPGAKIDGFWGDFTKQAVLRVLNDLASLKADKTLKDAIAQVDTKVTGLIDLVGRLPGIIEREGNELMGEFQDKVDSLIRKVGDQSTVIGGVGSLLDGLSQQVKDLQEAFEQDGDIEAAKAGLDALSQGIDANTGLMQAAVLKHTTAEGNEQHELHGITG